MTDKPTINQIIKERILILDGGLGTMIQRYGLQEEDFRGEVVKDVAVLLRGNNDLLPLTRPDIIEDIHRKYLEAGADIIETATFNAQRISQDEYGCGSLCREMNMAACAIARRLADEYSHRTPQKPRFVAGSVGPTSKTASLVTDVSRPEWRAVDFDQLVASYGEQIGALLDGGVDVLLIETIFDTLNAKAALSAAREEQAKRAKQVPVMLSVTIADKTGRMLSGQTIEAFLASVEYAQPFSVGLNCSFGPSELMPFVKELAAKAPYYISVYPNAGLPNALGEYDIGPERMASLMKAFIDENLVNIIGGCCGTTDSHIAKLQTLVKDANDHYLSPRVPVKPVQYLQLSGWDSLTLGPEMPFLCIGERCNVAGSRKFLRLISNRQYEEALAIARRQVEDGAQVIDINMDDGLLNAREEMVRFVKMLAAEPEVARVPVMIDSSDWAVIAEALKYVQGKSIVNSISLKEGEEIFLSKADYIRRMGAAVVVMAFDEEGQACSYEKKTSVCQRAYRLLIDRLDYDPRNIIFDPNILSIATGIAEHDNYAVNFIEAASWIRHHLPGAHVTGGVSNLSFSFRGNNHVREAMHAVFLHHAIAKGMDMGIVNPASRLTYEAVPQEECILLEDVVLNRKEDAADVLLRYISEHGDFATDAPKATLRHEDERKTMTLEARLVQSLVKGTDIYLHDDLEEAIGVYKRAVDIIEGPLMKGMGEVGEYFAAGKMFLPQVVRTARVMQCAVDYLSPYIATGEGGKSLGKAVLATVKGDVHDIGKNIVGVVLKCNNIDVVDLGVMCPADKIVEAVVSQKADMVGLCGLITPSLTEMINTVKALCDAGVSIPVIIGGATTSRLHTALRIAPMYEGPVIWSKDAAQTAVIATALMNPAKRVELIRAYKEEYDNLRHEHMAEEEKPMATLAEARRNKLDLFNCNCCKP